MTSRPVPRFRCGSLVSSLGASGLRLGRRGSRPAGGALRDAGRSGWQQPLSLRLYLGDGKQKAGSNTPRQVGTTPGTDGLAARAARKCSSVLNSQWEIARRRGWGGAGPGPEAGRLTDRKLCERPTQFPPQPLGSIKKLRWRRGGGRLWFLSVLGSCYSRPFRQGRPFGQSRAKLPSPIGQLLHRGLDRPSYFLRNSSCPSPLPSSIRLFFLRCSHTRFIFH